MCGRFSNRLTWCELHELMDLLGAPLNLRPRCNAAPGQDIAVVRVAGGGRCLWKLARRQAGLDGVRLHDWRHTFAS